MDQLDAERGADHGQVLAAVIAAVVDVQARGQAALEQGLLEDRQERGGILGEREGGVRHQARGVVQEKCAAGRYSLLAA